MQKKHLTAQQREQLRREKNKALAEKYVPKASELTVQELADSSASNKPVDVVAATEKSGKTRRHATKTKAKAMGHKSTLVFGGKVVVTSFADSRVGANGYMSSNIEKVTDFSGYADEQCERLSNPRMFNTNITASTISLKKEGELSTSSNPAAGNIGMDYVGLKSSIEKKVFGTEYSEDSLHVQIAYNIFDIKKILTTYINNIIYILCNLNRGKVTASEKSDDDIIERLYAFANIDRRRQNEYAFQNAIKFLKRCETYNVYFGDIFKKLKKSDDAKAEADKLSNNFNVLRMLAYAHNLCMHGLIDEKNHSMSDSALFDIKRLGQQDLLDFLDNTYSKAINKINKEFIANSGNNLFVLSKIYEGCTAEELAEVYYNLNIVKDGKNLGVKMTQLRECITAEYHKEVADKEFDTYRNKLYTILNFILYKSLCENDSLREAMVNELRANQADEEGKLLIYNKYAKAFEKEVGSKFIKAVGLLKDEVRGGKFTKKVVFDISKCKGVISGENTDYFVKLLYFIGKFLYAKEINELFCSMINKFDNIADLIETAMPFGDMVQFGGDDGYNLFLNSREIARQLRVAKNLASMGVNSDKKSKEKIKRGEGNYPEALFLDALALLGKDIVKYHNKDGRIVTDAHGKYQTTLQYNEFRNDFIVTGGRNRLRNFIINNVLKSKWFFYVVKYNSPSKCRKLMHNKYLLSLALTSIKPEQIKKYYAAVMGTSDDVEVEVMKRRLIDELYNFSAGLFFDDMRSKSEKDYKTGPDKDKMKGIVRLYLTLAYLITKSMVKVNTRFSIAWSTLERDYYIQYNKPLLYARVKKNDMGEVTYKTESHVLDMTRRFVVRDKKIMEKWNEQYAKIATIPKDDAHRAERKAALRQNDKNLKAMHYTKRFFKYISDYLESVDKNGWDNIEDNMFSFMRNGIMHLKVINYMSEPEYIENARCNTYYGLYCYILQRILFDKIKNAKLGEYLNAVKASGKYSKDLMWYLNLPFAYNLARYKNLSMEALFYDE